MPPVTKKKLQRRKEPIFPPAKPAAISEKDAA